MTLFGFLFALPRAGRSCFSRNRATAVQLGFLLNRTVICPTLGLGGRQYVPFAAKNRNYRRERGLLAKVAML
jgi:hypothetical protein